MPKSARPIVRSTFWALTPDEQTDRREEIEDLLKSIDNKIGDRRSDEEVAEVQGDDQLPRLELFGVTRTKMTRMGMTSDAPMPTNIPRRLSTNT